MQVFVRPTLRVRLWFVTVVVAVSIGARLVEWRLGVFGYYSEAETVLRHREYIQFLRLLSGLGLLAIIGLSLDLASKGRSHRFVRPLLIAVVGVELVFGILSGQKTALVMPMLVVGVTFYAVRDRFPRTIVFAAIVAVVIAYVVVEPLRLLASQDPSVRSAGIGEIGSRVVAIAKSSQSAEVLSEIDNIGLTFLDRQNFTDYAGRVIEYVETGEYESARDAPHFRRDLLLSPAYAVVPRFLWPSKPVQDVGAWFNDEVLGHSEFWTSSGMTPVGYLYFAGGVVGVLLGFFLIGVTQRIWMEAFLVPETGFVLVFLGGLTFLGTVPNVVYGVIIDFIRLTPMLLLIQYLIFRRSGSQLVTEAT